ncbi:MAG TPA: right-handed parallel beta-helix repeat-containing protein [Candidatus Acidoferrales bacterium]|nr:right-handed parallel beta-helix repeat-containing protein [Candidatus Acidoferrales bacterium]
MTTPRNSRGAIALASLLALAACSAHQSLPRSGTDAAARYVEAAAGSDANDGSAVHPYRTIGKCATTAKRGQTCIIRAGIYHEVLKPNSGITIRSGGGTVMLLATDPVTGWKRSAGSIYVARVTVNPHLAAGQVFIGPATTLVNEAQWPAPSNDPMHPNWAIERAGSGKTAIVDPTLPTSDLAGAIVNAWSGVDPWTHVTGVVTSASGGTIAFAPEGDGCPYFCSMPGGFYYVTGARALLRGQNEWWYDAHAHLLYLWASKGADPNKLDVEVKQRQVAIDLRGRSDVTVSNLSIAGAGVAMDARSRGNVLDTIDARYISSVTHSPNNVYYSYGNYPLESGLVLAGSHNTIQNSTIAYSATSGVLLSGSGNAVTNSLIHDVDWLGDYSAGVVPISPGNSISHTTIYNVGRSAITFGPTARIDIGYNNLFNSSLLSVDDAVIYACCFPQANGTRVHDNWVHAEIRPHGRLPHSNTCGCPWGGIYIDNGLGGIETDHNVVWASYPGIFLHGEPREPSIRDRVDYNTVLPGSQSIWLLNLAGYRGTEASHNRIPTPIATDDSSKQLPQTDNSRTAPGAGAIGQPGCSFAGCTPPGALPR